MLLDGAKEVFSIVHAVAADLSMALFRKSKGLLALMFDAVANSAEFGRRDATASAWNTSRRKSRGTVQGSQVHNPARLPWPAVRRRCAAFDVSALLFRILG